MSLILSGNSGSMTVDSTAGVTFPFGTNAQGAPAKVLQVVQVTNTSPVVIASGQSTPTAWQSVVAATITPLFATSKILILFNASWSMASGNTYCGCGFQPFRGTVSGTALGPVNQLIGYDTSASLGQRINQFAGSQIDSPATTSATLYTLGGRAENGAASTSANTQFNNYGPGTITLMEIAQ